MSKNQQPETQAAFIRSRLAKKSGVETILAEARKHFPKGKVARFRGLAGAQPAWWLVWPAWFDQPSRKLRKSCRAFRRRFQSIRTSSSPVSFE